MQFIGVFLLHCMYILPFHSYKPCPRWQTQAQKQSTNQLKYNASLKQLKQLKNKQNSMLKAHPRSAAVINPLRVLFVYYCIYIIPLCQSTPNDLLIQKKQCKNFE